MGWISNQISLADAIALRLEVWEVLITNWGDTGAFSPDDHVVTFPILDDTHFPQSLQTVYGVAIGPRSTVDRCWLAYDRQKNVTSLYPYFRPITVGVPLMFSQPAKIGQVVALPTTYPVTDVPSLVIYNGQIPYSITAENEARGRIQYHEGIDYTHWDGQSGDPYTLGAHDGPTPATRLWVPPVLHLYFYLKPPIAAPPMKRIPLYSDFAHTFDTDPGGPQVMGLYPTFGRKSISVTCTTSSDCNFYFGSIQQLNANGVPLYEHYIGKLDIVGTNVGQFNFTQNAGDYLIVYADPQGDGENVYHQVTATDDCCGAVVGDTYNQPT